MEATRIGYNSQVKETCGQVEDQKGHVSMFIFNVTGFLTHLWARIYTFMQLAVHDIFFFNLSKIFRNSDIKIEDIETPLISGAIVWQNQKLQAVSCIFST